MTIKREKRVDALEVGKLRRGRLRPGELFPNEWLDFLPRQTRLAVLEYCERGAQGPSPAATMENARTMAVFLALARAPRRAFFKALASHRPGGWTISHPLDGLPLSASTRRAVSKAIAAALSLK
jgi:hypothetical protein